MTTATIRADQASHRISRHIYGHFSEHLGRCIYDGYWVGESSTIPNTRGIRNDVVAALRAVRIPNLRWPGGCFADEYHWHDGVGPRDQRPPMVNTHWGGVTENNHFGTHEFMDLCEQLGCEPYICGNVGSGTVREMSQWVEYLTCGDTSPMAQRRLQNGRKEPWRVKYWGVGNENWGCGGNMRPEFYADQYRRYAIYCRNYGDNQLYRIACGANSDNYHWTEVLMREAGRFMDGLSLHHYSVAGPWHNKGPATVFGEDAWFQTMRRVWSTEELVTRHAAIMDKYDPERRVGMIVDEWGLWHDPEPGTNPAFLFQQNTMRDAVAAGVSLNIFNNHCDRIHMANLAQTVNVLQALVLTAGAKMLLTPTYHVFDLYKVHHDATLLPIEMETPLYKSGPGKLPAVSASASQKDGGPIHATLCNIDHDTAFDLDLEISGGHFTNVTAKALMHEDPCTHNTFDAPDALKPTAFDGVTVKRGTVRVHLPAASVLALELS